MWNFQIEYKNVIMTTAEDQHGKTNSPVHDHHVCLEFGIIKIMLIFSPH